MDSLAFTRSATSRRLNQPYHPPAATLPTSTSLAPCFDLLSGPGLRFLSAPMHVAFSVHPPSWLREGGRKTRGKGDRPGCRGSARPGSSRIHRPRGIFCLPASLPPKSPKSLPWPKQETVLGSV